MRNVIASFKPVHWVIIAVAFMGSCTVCGVTAMVLSESTEMVEPSVIVTPEPVPVEGETVAEPTNTPRPTATRSPTNTPAPDGFKDVKEWQEERCGDRNYVEDSVDEFLESLGFYSRSLGRVLTGWIGEDTALEDGRITNADFPLAYVITAQSYNDNAYGEKDRVRFVVRYDYACNVVDSTATEVTNF
ncbi:MAG: hypothetical protein F4X65_06415 [Chloroflexi bacterium]|nr:hypothetical protein [Chloroflexota bacterium]